MFANSFQLCGTVTCCAWCPHRYSETTRRLSEIEADNGILMRQLQALMPEVYIISFFYYPLLWNSFSRLSPTTPPPSGATVDHFEHIIYFFQIQIRWKILLEPSMHWCDGCPYITNIFQYVLMYVQYSCCHVTVVWCIMWLSCDL